MLCSSITKASVTDTRQSTSHCTGAAFVVLLNGKMCVKLLAYYIPQASLPHLLAKSLLSYRVNQ